MMAATDQLDALIEACYEHPDDLDVLTRFDHAFRPYMVIVLAALDADNAEDAYQAAFEKYIKIFRAGRKPSRNRIGYFVAVAKNCLIDERRRQREIPVVDELLETLGSIRSQDETERVDDRIALLEAMSRLDRRCQFVLESYYIREMPTRLLAIRLAISEPSVHMAVKRCRDQVRSQFAR
jgi:RNA polymerase sigma factor (sigma-70 family)